MKNFFYCYDCLAAFFSEQKAYDCPLCSSPMASSGWMQELDQERAEEASDSPSEPLAG